MKYSYYSLSEKFKNLFALIYTKLFFPNARLIRLPVYIRNKKQMQYDDGFTTGYGCRIDMMGSADKIKLKIGKNCIIGDCCQISALNNISIGNNLLMARNVYISDTNHGEYNNLISNCSPDIAPNERPLYSKDVLIGDNVWIGANVSVLAGVKIGNGCIIGANSVVNKDIPDNCIAVGSPARPIKTYNYDTCKWERIKSNV